MNQGELERLALLNKRLSRVERKIAFLFESMDLKYQETIPPFLEQSAQLLREGRRSEAIQAYIESTNEPLAEARAVIADLEVTLREMK